MEQQSDEKSQIKEEEQVEVNQVSLKEQKLKQQENELLSNKLAYIALNEENTNVKDITSEIFNTISNMTFNQKFETEDFNLQETMGATEIDHFKMDSHFQYKSTLTYKSAIKQGLIKNIKDLSLEEKLSLIDNLLIREVQWLSGGSINQTILSLLYFHHDYNSTDSKDDIISVYLNSYKQQAFLLNKLIEKSGCIRDDELIPNYKSLNCDYFTIKQFKDCEKQLKSLENNNNKTLINSLILRYKYRESYLTMINELMKENNTYRYKDFSSNLLNYTKYYNELVNDLSNSNLSLTEIYFNKDITKILPLAFSVKFIPKISMEAVVSKLKLMQEQLLLFEKIFNSREYFEISKYAELIGNQESFSLTRGLLEYSIVNRNKELESKFIFMNSLTLNDIILVS